ncbi:ABC transporter permease [Longispora albida]|uniref:ABC transporter permease n=1 Tax=Longispora albida TaxID=203523 RepID=UPI0006871ECE|nr:ABC transporter permease [Longispora albida]
MIRDSWTMTQRGLAHWVRMPGQVIAGMAFMIMLVVLFGYLFGGAMRVPGGGDYLEFLMPGMFVMAVTFGIAETMIAVQADADKGITDRFRSMPMSQAAVLAGRNTADMFNSVANLAILIATGLVLGWRVRGSALEAAAAIGLLLLLRLAVLWMGIYLGLLIRSAGAAAAVQTLLFPLTMVTSTFADPASMPAWLGAIAEWNPLSATVYAMRDLFGNPGAGGGSWVAEHALLHAFAWPVVLLAIFVPLSVHRYRNLSR